MASWKRKAEDWHPLSGNGTGQRSVLRPSAVRPSTTSIRPSQAAGTPPWRRAAGSPGGAGVYSLPAANASSVGRPRPKPSTAWDSRPSRQPWASANGAATRGTEEEPLEERPTKFMTRSASSRYLPSFQRVFIEQPEDISDEDQVQLEDLRASMEVVVEGHHGKAYAPVVVFEELDVLPEYVLQALGDMDFKAPMPIQAQALPIILGGHDLVGIAKTGSGKTLSYLLPAIVHIEAQRPLEKSKVTPIALILAPTRELAIQISEEADKLLLNSKEGNHHYGIWAAVVYGGKQKYEQVQNLRRGCHILVATPGRLMDLLEHKELSLDRVTYFVLDEADRMLDFGFQDDVNTILSSVRSDRHMLFFSATWPTAVQDLAKTLCKDGQEPVQISVGQHEDGGAATRADIVQEVVVFDQDTWEERDELKQKFLDEHVRNVLQDEENKVLVFVNNKSMADEMRDKLCEEGFKADSMHGGRPQHQRIDVLDTFKRGEIRLLVATDVMGRGLDIPDISHVVIYDMGDVDDYIHRIGRTARGLSGRGGHALTLFEYSQKWPELAGGLVQVLTDSDQEVPPELQAIADEVAAGERTIVERVEGACREKNQKKKWNKAEWNEGGAGWSEGGGKWDKTWSSSDAESGSWKGNGWKAWN